MQRWMVMGLVAWVTMTGCEGIGEDFSDLGRAFVPPSPGDAARMAVDLDDADRRREGTLLLSGAVFGGEPEYLAMYREYMENDENALVRAVATRGLGRHGTPEDAVLIAARLEDPNDAVRWEAAKALQRLHNPLVVRALLRTLREPEETSDVRVATATALGQYPEDRVVQGLVQALDATELSVNLAAAQSLRTLTGQDFGLDPPTWLEWYAEAKKEAFAGQTEFNFPVYSRDPSLLERLIFWRGSPWETSGPPRGLNDESASDEAPADESSA